MRHHSLAAPTASPTKSVSTPCRRMRYYPSFLKAIPHTRAGYPRVTHPSATRPLAETNRRVRLACVRHAASVCPEPGSNSPSKLCLRKKTHVMTRAALSRCTSCICAVCTARRLHDSKNIDVCYPHRHQKPETSGSVTHSAYRCFSLFSCSGSSRRSPPRQHVCARRKIEINTTQSACQAICRTISAPYFTMTYGVGDVGTATLA